MKARAAALFLFTITALLGRAPAFAHSLDEVQADLQQREPNVAFEPDVGSPFPPFHLQDPDGKTVDLRGLRGKVVVLDFVSAGCGDGCAAASELMSQIQSDVAAGGMADQVELVSITMDPERDTAAIRKAYGPAHGLKTANWTFLAGPSDEVLGLVRATGLKSGPDGALAQPPVTYVPVTYVVDSAGMLRARFFGVKYDPLNLVVYVNALTNDHHELEPAKPETSFWQKLKRRL